MFQFGYSPLFLCLLEIASAKSIIPHANCGPKRLTMFLWENKHRLSIFQQIQNDSCSYIKPARYTSLFDILRHDFPLSTLEPSLNHMVSPSYSHYISHKIPVYLWVFLWFFLYVSYVNPWQSSWSPRGKKPRHRVVSSCVMLVTVISRGPGWRTWRWRKFQNRKPISERLVVVNHVWGTHGWIMM